MITYTWIFLKYIIFPNSTWSRSNSTQLKAFFVKVWLNSTQLERLLAQLSSNQEITSFIHFWFYFFRSLPLFIMFVSSAKYIENRLVMDSMSAVYSEYVSGPAEKPCMHDMLWFSIIGDFCCPICTNCLRFWKKDMNHFVVSSQL